MRSENLRREKDRIAKELAESEERFRWLFNSMVEGFAYCKMLFENDRPMDFVYLEVNPAFEKLTGLKDVVGRKVSEIIPGIRELDPELFEIYGRVASTGEPERFETYVGALQMWFSISVYSPKREHFVAVFDVITARKQAEEQMKKLLTAVEQAPDTVIITDTGGIIEYVNPAFEKLTGYSKAEAMGRTPAFLKSGKHGTDFYQKMWQIILSGQEFRAEFINKRKDGTLYHHETTIAPLRDTDGKTTHFVATGRDISQSKRSEHELRLFRTLVDRSNDGVEVVDPETGRFLDVNEKSCLEHGYTREEYLSLRVFDVDPSVNQPLFVELVSKLRKTGHMMWSGVHRRKDGSTFPVEVNIKHIQLDREYILAVVRDVTERMKAEEERRKVNQALRESEEQYRIVTETVSDAILALDSDSRILFANSALKNIFGYHPDEVLDRKVTDLMPESLRARHFECMSHYVNTGKRRIEWRLVELTGLHKNGKEIPIEVSFAESTVRNGKRLFIGIVRDISKRKETEEALRQSEEKFRALFEESRDTIFISSPDGALLDINPAGVAMFGYSSREEILKLDVANSLYVHPEDRKRYREVLERDGFVKDYELMMKKKDGQKIWILETSTAVRDRDGRIVAYRGINRDVTDRKRLQGQLLQAQKMETIGRLAGGVAHDFNNILMAVSSYCELLLIKMPHHDPLRQDVQEILKAQRRGASLTRQLLAFSRKQVLEPKIFDLNAVVLGMENLLQRLIGEDIELTILADGDTREVEADPGQIEQVIMNLAVNSRDAMPRGGRLTIEVSDTELDEAYVKNHLDARMGPHVTLSVADTGQGMDTETLSHVFEPFFTTKDKEKGTGLGLATVYGIVTQSHGSITVYSEPGQGTAFRIYLPRVYRAGMQKASEQATLSLIGGSETILLVDDNETVRTAIAELLKMQGYSVLLAGDGRQALEVSRVHEGTIDLLVTDVVMPGMSGRELAHELTAERSGVKVLYMSGYTDDAVLRHGILDSDSAFLQKPAPMSTFFHKIRTLLD